MTFEWPKIRGSDIIEHGACSEARERHQVAIDEHWFDEIPLDEVLKMSFLTGEDVAWLLEVFMPLYDLKAEFVIEPTCECCTRESFARKRLWCDIHCWANLSKLEAAWDRHTFAKLHDHEQRDSEIQRFIDRVNEFGGLARPVKVQNAQEGSAEA